MTDREKIEKLQDAIVEASNLMTITVSSLSNPKNLEDILEGYKKYGELILRVHKEIFNPVMQSMIEK